MDRVGDSRALKSEGARVCVSLNVGAWCVNFTANFKMN